MCRNVSEIEIQDLMFLRKRAINVCGGFWQGWSEAQAKRNAVPVKPLEWATILRQQNKANVNGWTANNPRQKETYTWQNLYQKNQNK